MRMKGKFKRERGEKKADKSQKRAQIVHVPNFEGVAGSKDFACATLPTTPLDFQGKI